MQRATLLVYEVVPLVVCNQVDHCSLGQRCRLVEHEPAFLDTSSKRAHRPYCKGFPDGQQGGHAARPMGRNHGPFTPPLHRMPERMGAAISVDAKTRPQETGKTTIEQRFPTASTRIIVTVKQWLPISGGSFTSLTWLKGRVARS
jgi:hypothetical protein